MRDLYSILGISKDADQASIRKAYKKLARKYHPDLNKESGADERFKEVNTAYEVLSDEQRRSLYDTFGAESLKQGFNPDAARQWRQATGGAGGFGGGDFGRGGFGGGGFGGGMDIDDLLNAFGGRFKGGPQPRQQHQQQPRQQKGPDIEQALSCTVEELLSGDKKVVVVRRPSPCGDCGGRGGAGKHACPACAGTGRTKVGDVHFPCVACSGAGHRFQMECSTCEGTGRTMNEERLKVGIPPGVQPGQTIRLRAKGGAGLSGAKPGDLLLAIHIEKHALYEIDGVHLVLNVPLTILEAMRGGKIKVPTPDGPILVSVPQGVTPGTMMRIKGRGLPKSKDTRGDLRLVLQPTPPPSDDEEAISHAEALDAHYSASLRDWD